MECDPSLTREISHLPELALPRIYTTEREIEWPLCHTCGAQSHACDCGAQGESQQLLSGDTKRGTSDTIPMIIDASPIPDLPQSRKRIFEFYDKKTTPGLAGYLLLCHASNPWWTDLMPLAMGNTLVHNAVMAVGGTHLATTEQDKSIRQMAINHYGKAICELNIAIHSWMEGKYKETLHLLFATCLLSTYEVRIMLYLGPS